jgi:hypothetical protein
MPKKSDHNLFQCSAKEAFDTAKANEYRRYPSPERGKERLYPLTNPALNPGFSIKQDDTIYAIGSCFARNIEGALHKAGMNVLSMNPELGKLGEQIGKAANYLNKYNAPSIYNDLRWALERDTFNPAKVIYNIDENFYSDPQLGLSRIRCTYSEILDFRERYLNSMAQIAQADVVVLTLGYVEVWYDTVLKIYLNIAPPQVLHTLFPNRFEFRVLGYQDVLDSLHDIYKIITKHNIRGVKMLITVSPVPLLSTFRDVDVLVANAYSKSVQRAAVEAFVMDKDNVDYFPSYESVTLSNPDISWARGDYRHVSPDLVTRIMTNVIDTYVEDKKPEQTEMSSVSNIISTATLLGKLGKHEELLGVHSEHPEVFKNNVGLLLLLANSCSYLNQGDTLIEALETVVELAPERPVPLQRLIKACVDYKKQENLAELFALHEKNFPTRTIFRNRYKKFVPKT